MEPEHTDYNQRIREHLRASYLLSEEKIEKVMPQFLETIRSLLSELNELADQGKSDALSRAGHAMKGALLNLGLHDLAQKALCIEKHQELNGAGQSGIGLVEELRQELNKFL